MTELLSFPHRDTNVLIMKELQYVTITVITSDEIWVQMLGAYEGAMNRDMFKKKIQTFKWSNWFLSFYQTADAYWYLCCCFYTKWCHFLEDDDELLAFVCSRQDYFSIINVLLVFCFFKIYYILFYFNFSSFIAKVKF